MDRRQVILIMGKSIIFCGCGGESISNLDTSSLENAKSVSKLIYIVSFEIGKRTVKLPHPASKIVGVCLIIVATGSFLFIEYLDDELRKRYLREEISEQLRMKIEDAKSVIFTQSDGTKVELPLGENRYDFPESTDN